MELLATVEIPQYVRLILLAEKRREVYYEKGKKVLPEKWAKQIGVNVDWQIIKGKILLCDAENKPIIANPTTAGTPRGYVIAGNDLHSLRMMDSTRSKIMKAIKAQFTPIIEQLEPITKFPIRILMELHDTVEDEMYISSKTKTAIKNINWDIDNRALFYAKAFPDILSGSPMIKEIKEGREKIKRTVLTSKQIIPNDERRYITQPPVPLFYPIENTKDRKIVFKIYHDDREIIKNHPAYGINRSKIL